MSPSRGLSSAIDVLGKRITVYVRCPTEGHVLVQQEVVITVRVPAELARQARAVADHNDETLSQVLRRALRTYVGRTPDQLDCEDVAVRQ